jgi:hypothetical protein
VQAAPVQAVPIEQVAAGIAACAPVPDEEPVHRVEMPSIGRIVIVLGRYPLSPEPPGPVGCHMPAIVTRVHSPALIDATLFPPGAPPLPCVRVHFGEAPGQWCWPSRHASLLQAG